MSRSIYWRITIPFTLLVLVSMGILGFYMVDFVRDSQIDHLRSHLGKEAQLVADASLPGFLDPGRYDSLEAIAENTGEQIEARVTIIALDGTVLGDSNEDPLNMENHATRPEVMEALASGIGESTRYSTTIGKTMMYVAVPVASQGEVLGIARVALPLTAVESSMNSAVQTIVWAMLVATLLVILAAALIARMITRPVRQVTRAAQRIASGQFDQQIHAQTNDELGQLGHAFNEMSVSLKETMATISGEKSRLATVLSNMTDGVIMTDPQGDVVLANPAAERLFGFTEAKATGQPLIEVIPDHEIDELLKKCLKMAREQAAQLDTVTGRFLRVIAVPLVASKFAGVLLLFQDLTEMRSLQTMRREFVGNISHEIRTPLAAIKAIVETLQDGALDDRETARDFLDKVNAEVDRMTQMVTELIELSRIETGRVTLKLEPVNVNSLIEEGIARLSPQAERQQIALVAELSGGLPPLRVDRDRIQQTITNIVHNGIKFNRPGGRITVSTRSNMDSVIVSVSDTGIGISREDLPHIFERFYKADKSRSSGGTGLGLAIAKHIVEAHGGRIWVESVEGRGSTFYFTLPLATAP